MATKPRQIDQLGPVSSAQLSPALSIAKSYSARTTPKHLRLVQSLQLHSSGPQTGTFKDQTGTQSELILPYCYTTLHNPVSCPLGPARVRTACPLRGLAFLPSAGPRRSSVKQPPEEGKKKPPSSSSVVVETGHEILVPIAIASFGAPHAYNTRFFRLCSSSISLARPYFSLARHLAD